MNGAPSHVRIDDLPVSVIDDTVRVEIEGPAIATNLRVSLDAPRADEAAEEVTPELRAAQRDVAVAEAEVERLDAAIARLAETPVIEEDPSDDPPAPWIKVALARRATVALRAERELALRTERTSARRILEEAQRALEAATDRERRSGSAKAAKLHELRKHVDVELQSTGDGDVKLTLEYQVGAARWAPSYVAKLDGDRAVVEVRAIVAQDTGEDWTTVPLRLSTAEPERFSQLPELAAQRIGRRQQEPAKAGFRAPPTGADALYADYDRGLQRKPPSGATKRAPTTEFQTTDALYVGAPPEEPYRGAAFGGAAGGDDWDEGSSRAQQAYANKPMPPPPPAQAAPVAEMKKSRREAAPGAAPAKTMMLAVGGYDAKPAVPREPTPRLDYANMRMAAPTSPQRGQLVPAERDRRTLEIEGEVTSAHARLVSLPLPPGCIASWSHAYDYAFATDGAVDVKSDGAWHSIAVTQKPSTAKVRHVSVPREQADVFRMAQIVNPFVGPLLPGPIDVYDQGRFLVTSEVDYTPPGARVDVGLGVDPAVKIARNTEFREEATGMLRGALRLHHAITIDVDNVSGRAVDLEVRERVPVASEGEDKVEIVVRQVEPSWERWTPDTDAPHERRLRGGYRWRMQLPAGQKKKMRAAYEVEIAGKLELVGGNRRES